MLIYRNYNVMPLFGQNLLDNPDFLINQRGEKTYINTVNNNNIYTIDRWRIHNIGTKLTTYNGYITISNETNDGLDHYIAQYKEEKDIIQAGETLTFSMKYKTTSNNMYVCFNERIVKLNQTNDWKIFQYTFVSTSNIAKIVPVIIPNFETSQIGSIDIAWVKLEYGNTLTPFVPPNSNQELIKCKYYYQELLCNRTLEIFTEDLLIANVQFEAMRVTPTNHFKNNTFNKYGYAYVQYFGLEKGFNFSLQPTADITNTIHINAEKQAHGLIYPNILIVVTKGNPICIDAEIY